MAISAKKQSKPDPVIPSQDSRFSAVEEIIEQKLEDLTTVLSNADNGKSRVHEEVMTMVEKGLFKIALRRSSNVKSAAAAFLGMNRNTFTDKMAKMGLNGEKAK